ncbi:MAG: hypothetical protein ACWA5R_04595 [bacterium]
MNKKVIFEQQVEAWVDKSLSSKDAQVFSQQLEHDVDLQKKVKLAMVLKRTLNSDLSLTMPNSLKERIAASSYRANHSFQRKFVYPAILSLSFVFIGYRGYQQYLISEARQQLQIAMFYLNQSRQKANTEMGQNIILHTVEPIKNTIKTEQTL